MKVSAMFASINRIESVFLFFSSGDGECLQCMNVSGRIDDDIII